MVNGDKQKLSEVPGKNLRPFFSFSVILPISTLLIFAFFEDNVRCASRVTEFFLHFQLKYYKPVEHASTVVFKQTASSSIRLHTEIPSHHSLWNLNVSYFKICKFWQPKWSVQFKEPHTFSKKL